jgi:hypothetical protein
MDDISKQMRDALEALPEMEAAMRRDTASEELEKRAAETEESNRRWKLQNYLRAVTGSGQDMRVINWSATPRLRVWK